jgi:hypothetical protein
MCLAFASPWVYSSAATHTPTPKINFAGEIIKIFYQEMFSRKHSR